MADRIIFTKPDRTIQHIIPAMKNKRQGESLDSFVERTAKHALKLEPELVRLPPGTKLPTHRFRGSWRWSGSSVQVDMPLARVQRMAEIRAERDSRFPTLDAEWMRATGQKKTAEADAIEVKRQTLRDIPAKVNLSTLSTPEDLEAYEPQWEAL